MNTDKFDLKKGDPIIAENHFGTIAGYYTETITNKGGIWVRFTKELEISGISRALFIRNINEVRKATSEEVKKINT